ncbi:MAG: RdgB/HAM1 family non-canonical purine NTP pyrophosphatase [Gammaproteobacteria bacterium]
MTSVPSRWVLASGNSGKLREIQALLTDSGIELVAQGELDVRSPEETGATFVENALLKARHAALETGLPAIADDSGLAVDALAGAPGIHSARFAGPGADTEANMVKLLDSLAETPDDQRGARYHCVIVALLSADDPAPLISYADWPGVIARQPAGEGGFGYDPIFYDPELGATAAQLSAEVKNRVSHRGRALAILSVALKERLTEASPPDR